MRPFVFQALAICIVLLSVAVAIRRYWKSQENPDNVASPLVLKAAESRVN